MLKMRGCPFRNNIKMLTASISIFNWFLFLTAAQELVNLIGESGFEMNGTMYVHYIVMFFLQCIHSEDHVEAHYSSNTLKLHIGYMHVQRSNQHYKKKHNMTWHDHSSQMLKLNLRHIRLSVPWKSVSVWRVYEVCKKALLEIQWQNKVNNRNFSTYEYSTNTEAVPVSRNCFIFWLFETVFWISW